jgi:hypothetical protein
VLAVAESLAEGFKPDDKRRVHVVAETTEGSTANWRQVTSPPPDVDAIREAARAGEVVDDQRTVTDLEEFGVSEGVSDSSAPSPEFDRVAASNGEALAQLEDEGKPQPRKRGRPRAAAGNLAGAVKREVAKATGDRKINPKRSGGGKK